VLVVEAVDLPVVIQLLLVVMEVLAQVTEAMAWMHQHLVDLRVVELAL
jgi:hypothetical protein